MAAKDLYHEAVVKALEKEGWKITHDPYSFKAGGVKFVIDLGGEKVIAATKGVEKIAVEIKSFIKLSPVQDFHEAAGQYDNYRLALELREPERVLYLAIPRRAYRTFFQLPFVQYAIKRKEIKLIVYVPKEEKIDVWID